MTDVLISTSSFGRVSSRPLERLREAGFEVRMNPHGRTLQPSEAVALLAGAEGVIAGTEPLDRQTLESLPALRAIARLGAGLENVDLAAAADLGIAVTSTPEPPARAVAELALGGLLAISRGLCPADRALRQGEWEKPMGRLLRAMTVGVIGTGRAGRALIRLLAAFECRVLAVDITPDAGWAETAGVTYVEIDELLEQADAVSLHVPLTTSTRRLIDGERMAKMKKGALLVNCARGGLVDEAALTENLGSGRLGGAFLDVFEDEPYRGPLTNSPNTLLTPHIGSYAAECRLQMELQAVDNLVRSLEGGRET